MTLTRRHVQPCLCSRCRVAGNYARLRAAQALRDEADAAQTVAAEPVRSIAKPHRSDRDAVGHVV